ncbi:MAG: hypothetical protein ACFFDN_10795 [Candidatus Hodarchaeota archaeon]
MNISQDKWDWVEVTLVTGYKFYIPEHIFTEKYENKVGQHMTRLGSFNEAYIKQSQTSELIKVRRVRDNSFRVNFNITATAINVDKKVEIV